jgi:hypothetical protein
MTTINIKAWVYAYLIFFSVWLVIAHFGAAMAQTTVCRDDEDASSEFFLVHFEDVVLRVCKSFVSTYGKNPEILKDSIEVREHMPVSLAFEQAIWALLEVAIGPESSPFLQARSFEQGPDGIAFDGAIIVEALKGNGVVHSSALGPGGLAFDGELRLQNTRVLPFQASCSGQLSGLLVRPEGVASCSSRFALGDHTGLLVRYTIWDEATPIEAFSVLSDWVSSLIVLEASAD